MVAEGAGGGFTEPVSNAANELVKTGILGAMLVLVGAFAVYLLIKLNKAHESRIEDQKATTKAILDLSVSMKDAVKEMTQAMGKVCEASDDSKVALDRLDRTIDNVVRDAVRWGYRKPTPPSGLPRGG
jgi:hypothetical protein